MRKATLASITLLAACDPARYGSIAVAPAGPLSIAARDSVIQRTGRILGRGGVDAVATTMAHCSRQWRAAHAVPDGLGATFPLSVCLDTNTSAIIIRFDEGIGDTKLTPPSDQLRRSLADSLRDLGRVTLGRAS